MSKHVESAAIVHRKTHVHTFLHTHAYIYKYNVYKHKNSHFSLSTFSFETSILTNQLLFLVFLMAVSSVFSSYH